MKYKIRPRCNADRSDDATPRRNQTLFHMNAPLYNSIWERSANDVMGINHGHWNMNPIKALELSQQGRGENWTVLVGRDLKLDIMQSVLELFLKNRRRSTCGEFATLLVGTKSWDWNRVFFAMIVFKANICTSCQSNFKVDMTWDSPPFMSEKPLSKLSRLEHCGIFFCNCNWIPSASYFDVTFVIR